MVWNFKINQSEIWVARYAWWYEGGIEEVSLEGVTPKGAARKGASRGVPRRLFIDFNILFKLLVINFYPNDHFTPTTHFNPNDLFPPMNASK